MKKNKILKYRIGVELLDENKNPLEHLEYEEDKSYDCSLDLYNKFKTNSNTAKYLFAILRNDDFVELLSYGYKK